MLLKLALLVGQISLLFGIHQSTLTYRATIDFVYEEALQYFFMNFYETLAVSLKRHQARYMGTDHRKSLI
jgi:hypothetical protein